MPHAPATDTPHRCRNTVVFCTEIAVVDWRISDGYEMNVHADPLRPDGPGCADDETCGYFQARQHLCNVVFAVANDRLLRLVAVGLHAPAAQTSSSLPADEQDPSYIQHFAGDTDSLVSSRVL